MSKSLSTRHSRYIGAMAVPVHALLATVLALLTAVAQATVGLTEIEGIAPDGPVTIFFLSKSETQQVHRSSIQMDVAWNGAPVRGNGRLIVISHGSPASPWVYADLARALVEAGFVVAFPEHLADNYKNDSEPGIPSWKRRPLEVSRAIDVIGRDARFGSLLSLDKVGMYGMSAGGHTALTLAGGRWSPAQLLRHCESHIAEDFHACVGPSIRLTGGFIDSLKTRIALGMIRGKLSDEAWYSHTDPRISAIVAGVPFAADFEMESFAAIRVPLGIVTARADRWLIPKFHSDKVLLACPTCIRVADLENGGHGALLSPLLPNRSGPIADLIDDPSGFDRARVVPDLNGKIASFFQKHLPLPR
jgi:predicted dienelactone hydrolase